MPPLAEYVISKPPRPWRCVILALVTALIVFFVQAYFVEQSAKSRDQQLKLSYDKQEYQLLTEQQKVSQEQLLSLGIQKETNQQLQEQLNILQDKVITLKKELAFYQAINQANRSSKLQFRELRLRTSKTQPDIFQYQFVVTQGQHVNAPIKGTITVLLNGTQNKKPVQISLGKHSLTLRHVQVIEGQLKLADDVIPKSFTVILKQNKKITLTQNFDWKIDSND